MISHFWEKNLKKRNFIATHTFHSPQSKKEFFAFIKELKTNSEWFIETDEIKDKFLKSLISRGLIDGEGLENVHTSDYAVMLQIFVGRSDFFFCHWMAIDEQSIIDRLIADGSDEFMITMATPVEFPKMNLDYIMPMIKKIK